jgi:hypothetical protein
MNKHFVSYWCGSGLLMRWLSLFLACQRLSSGTNLRECEDHSWFKRFLFFVSIEVRSPWTPGGTLIPVWRPLLQGTAGHCLSRPLRTHAECGINSEMLLLVSCGPCPPELSAVLDPALTTLFLRGSTLTLSVARRGIVLKPFHAEFPSKLSTKPSEVPSVIIAVTDPSLQILDNADWVNSLCALGASFTRKN